MLIYSLTSLSSRDYFVGSILNYAEIENIYGKDRDLSFLYIKAMTNLFLISGKRTKYIRVV
jgi:hypothetical protein